ncbi:MAG: C25 family cysteine peptidase, partial [Lentisphaerota bacterium]
MLFATASVPAAQTPSRILHLTLEAAPFEFITQNRELPQICMAGFEQDGAPGSPLLPSKTVDIALPPDTDLSTVQLRIVSQASKEQPGSFSMAPAPPAGMDRGGELSVSWGAAVHIADGKDLEVYGRNAFYPEQPVSIQAVSEMRKWKFARLVFHPLQYNPVEQKLLLNSSLEIELSFSSARTLAAEPAGRRALLTDTAMDEKAAAMFLNFPEARNGYEQEALALESELRSEAPSTAYDYAIITTAAMTSNVSKIADFKTHLQSQGFSVIVVTEADYGALAGQAPNGTAEKIRKWLIDHYAAMGLQYALLIGNPDPADPSKAGDAAGDVPMKMCWPRRYNADGYESSPTDYFYADLTGNWDLDGDGYYGEYSGDRGTGGVDFTPEVYVSRIPVYNNNYASANATLQKIITYESDGSSPAWRKKMLLPMALSNYANEDNHGYARSDGRNAPKRVIENYLTASGFSYHVFYEKSGLTPVPNTADYDNASHAGLTKANFLAQWTNGYGCVFWWA